MGCVAAARTMLKTRCFSGPKKFWRQWLVFFRRRDKDPLDSQSWLARDLVCIGGVTMWGC